MGEEKTGRRRVEKRGERGERRVDVPDVQERVSARFRSFLPFHSTTGHTDTSVTKERPRR